MRRWFHYVFAAILGWLVFLTAISALPVLSGIFTWKQSFYVNLHQWLPWMLFSPLVAWLALRLPIEGARSHWRLLLHLLLGGLVVLTCAALSERFPPSHEFDHGHGGPNHFDQPEPEPGQAPPDFEPRPPRSPPPDGPLSDFHGPPLWVRAGFHVPVWLAIVGLCHALIYSRRTRQRERRALELETQLGQARLQALRMQLQPHFLFNTLNAISTLVQTNPQAAQEMIGSLGQMLRLSLDNAPKPEVPLAQELEFLDCYLEITQVRFGDRLQVKHDIAPGTGRALVPTFILQPLVENAVRHGIEPGAGPGRIAISVRLANGRLCLAIYDSGVGLAAGAPPAATGIGIANTRARLQNLYPGQHYFAVRNAPGGGCVAELEIPFHTEPLTPLGGPKTE